MREYRYTVDRDGRIVHDGTEIIDPLVLRFFLGAMRRDSEGRYLVVCQGEWNWFEPWDTPFVVQRLRIGREGRLGGVELCFAGDWRESLDPVTLETDGSDLFCHIRAGTLPARFGRVAMQQLAPILEDKAEGPVLRLGGTVWPIRMLAPAH